MSEQVENTTDIQRYKNGCPKSTTEIWVNVCGLLSGAGALLFLKLASPNFSQWLSALLVFIATITPIVLLELSIRKVQHFPSNGLRKTRKTNIKRILTKLLGLVFTYGVFAFLYWLFPEYHKPLYRPFWQFVAAIMPLAIPFSIVYFWIVDRRQAQPKDNYYKLGRALLFKEKMPRDAAIRHFRDWLVKAFFTPLMISYLAQSTNYFIGLDLSRAMDNFHIFYDLSYNLIFLIDLLFAAVGYVMTFRLLDTHIRSSEPTFFGWIIAVMCYAPFWTGVFYGNYFAYNDGLYWDSWLRNDFIKISWGISILVLVSIYSYATVAFGYRFSNLTYRGLISNGPYRFTKHPAYLTKNLSWWMISIPFISNASFYVALQHSILLLGVNLIYFARARTEENHLSNYPEYVEYGKWINEHGLLAPMGKILPFFAYKPCPSKI